MSGRGGIGEDARGVSIVTCGQFGASGKSRSRSGTSGNAKFWGTSTRSRSGRVLHAQRHATGVQEIVVQNFALNASDRLREELLFRWVRTQKLMF